MLFGRLFDKNFFINKKYLFFKVLIFSVNFLIVVIFTFIIYFIYFFALYYNFLILVFLVAFGNTLEELF